MFIGMVSHSSYYRVLLVLLPSEGASFCKPYFSSCRLTEDGRAANTQNYCLCMAENGGDFIASWAFYIHEIGIGALHQAFLLVFPLFLFWRGWRRSFARGMFSWWGHHRRKDTCFESALEGIIGFFGWIFTFTSTSFYCALSNTDLRSSFFTDKIK